MMIMVIENKEMNEKCYLGLQWLILNGINEAKEENDKSKKMQM